MAKRYGMRQTTLRERVVVSGVGVHGGQRTSIAFNPAEADSGIVFCRTDRDHPTAIRAAIENWSPSDLCTTVGMGDASVATIEHVMAALSALEIDNVLVEIDGAEVPMMDGSAAAFVEAIDAAGIATLAAPRRFIKVLKPVRIDRGAAFAELRPHDGRRFEIEIDFESALVGRQAFVADLDPAAFRNELARARTFGFMADVEMLLARGLARGASLENAIVIGEDRILNPEGLRFADEFVRHKTLDAVGDLALAGMPILGAYRSYRGGHRLNAMVVEALLADRNAWTMVEAAAPRREPVLGEVSVGLAAAAFGPDVS